MNPVPAAVTAAALVERHAADPAAVFVVALDEYGAGRTITYREQLDRTRRTAGALHELGAGPGTRVHAQLGNCAEFYDIWFACGLLGATFVPTNPQSTPDETAFVVGDVSPAVSIGPQALPLAELAAHIAAVSGEVSPVRVAATDAAAVLYTSGTTSRPKGVLVTHANYAAVGNAIAQHLSMTAADRWLIALPLFHANAQYYCTMSALVTGGSIVLAPRFSASRWGAQAAEHGATLGSLFAAPVRMILANPSVTRPTALRAVLFAQNVTDAQAQEFEHRFGTRLLQLYGMTETVVPPTINPDSDARRWSSIGRPIAGVEVRLVDAGGDPVTAGQAGELQMRGEPGRTVAGGYLGHPEATAAAFADGWLRTGDLARVDGDGYLYFVDRAKDMIKRSGENIAAGEIERVLNEHSAVAESAAIGVADPIRDEAIVAYVVTRPGRAVDDTELTDWCRERLSSFKVPERFEFLDALPRTSVGKIRKEVLRTAASTAQLHAKT